MKFLVTVIATAMMFLNVTSPDQKTSITVSVNNVSSNSGKVSFALYNQTTFMKTPLQAKNGKIVEGKSTVVFENLEPGEYAIICFHDKNNNDKMDFQPSGMPMEDYGTSNNVMTFGPPSYENAKFTLGSEDLSLEIKF